MMVHAATINIACADARKAAHAINDGYRWILSVQRDAFGIIIIGARFLIKRGWLHSRRPFNA